MRQTPAFPTRSFWSCWIRGCDHDECRAAANQARRDQRRRHNRPDAVGSPTTIPAGAVRTHIAELRAAGLGVGAIASRAGIVPRHLERIISGEIKRVTPATKDRILGVLATGPAPGALVDASETLERVADLYAAGYSQLDVARGTGLPLSTVRSVTTDRASVRARTANAIADFHEAAGLAAAGWRDPVDPLDEWRILLSEIGDQTWRRDAECGRLDGDVRERVNLFYPDRGGDLAAPRAVCARCPVREPCLDYAVTTGTLIGVWAGTSGDERRDIRHLEVVAERAERAS